MGTFSNTWGPGLGSGGGSSWTPAQAPSNLVVTVISGGLRISWTDNSSKENGFEIWMSIDGGEFTLLETVDINVTSYDDMVSHTGHTVFYKVRAITDTTYSSYTSESEITLTDVDYDALIVRMNVEPNTETKTLIQDLIIDLKNNGLWTKLDCLWMLCTHDEQASRLNWIKDDFNLSLVSTPAFTPYRGWLSNGASYFKSGFYPGSNAEKLTLDSGILGMKVLNNMISTSVPQLGCMITGAGAAGAYFSSQIRFTGDKCYGAVNTNTFQYFANTNTIGRYMWNRTASNVQKGYKDGVKLQDGTQVSTFLPDSNFYILAGSKDGDTLWSCSVAELAYVFIGGGCSEADALKLDELLEAFYNNI